MFTRMQDLLQWRAELLLDGRIEDLSCQFLFPMATYVQDRPIVAETPEILTAALGRMHRLLRRRQVQRCIATVVAVEIPRQGRFRVWARWQEQARDPALNSGSDMVHYFRLTDGGPRSEMIEYRHLGTTAMLRAMQPQHKTA